MKNILSIIIFLLPFSLNAQYLDRLCTMNMHYDYYNDKKSDNDKKFRVFQPCDCWFYIDSRRSSDYFKPMFPYEGIDGLYFLYEQLELTNRAELDIFLLANSNTFHFFKNYYISSIYNFGINRGSRNYTDTDFKDYYIDKKTLFILSDSLSRPKQELYYLDSCLNKLRLYTIHSYGEDSIDTVRTYINTSFNYLYQKELYMKKMNGALYSTDTILLTTSIYKQGKLISLHHDYLEKLMRLRHAAAYLNHRYVVPIVPYINFTYQVFYNEDGTIDKILAPIVSEWEAVFTGVGLEVTYPIQIAEYNFKYEYHTNPQHLNKYLRIEVTSPDLVNYRKAYRKVYALKG